MLSPLFETIRNLGRFGTLSGQTWDMGLLGLGTIGGTDDNSAIRTIGNIYY